MKKINVLAASLFIAALVVGASSLGSMTQAQSTPAVACSVSQSSVLINNPITLTATGGDGVYTWSSANFVLNNPTTNTSSLTLTYTVPGNYMVTVMSNGSSATCFVAITAIEFPAPGSAIEAPAPGLPNTGELPL
jgi:hypothetical protein